MAFSNLRLVLWLISCALFVDAVKLAVHRDDRFEHPNLLKRQTGFNDAKLGKSLYWYGYWDVGAVKHNKLLIDTGSADLILPKGRYKPSRYHQPYHGNKTFHTMYEGVNRQGFGFQESNGTVREDIVSTAGISVYNQAIGELVSNKFIDVPTPKNFNLSAGNGIIGFLGRYESAFEPPARSWFRHLCLNRALSECRFGLAFGTGGTGQVVLGELDHSLINGDLVQTDIVETYNTQGDVVLNGEVIYKNQTIIYDVGTDNLQGPVDATKAIFKTLGFQAITKTGYNLFDPSLPVENVFGYFDCTKIPNLGFAFPAQVYLKPGQKQRTFYISNSTGIWDVYKHSANNCTSILGATNAINSGNGGKYWLIGQPFFQGHYIDFNEGHGVINIGDLANPETGM